MGPPRAERRAGELLAADPAIGRGTKSPTLGDFDINANQSSRWQAIASTESTRPSGILRPDGSRAGGRTDVPG